jgi:hypothetical protein
MVLVKFVLYARLVGDPVYFPSFAAVVGEGLFEVRRICCHVRPNKSNLDGLAINRILGEKLTASILEFADLRWVQDANLAIGPVEAPLVGLRIVGAQGETFDVTSGAVGDELIDFGTVVDFAAEAGTFVVDPGIGAGEGIHAAPEVIFPGTQQRIKIVRPVPFSSALSTGFRHVGILPGKSPKRKQKENRA